MKRLVQTALILGLAGGWAYGQNAAAEGIPSQTTGQTPRTMETLLKKGKEESNQITGGVIHEIRITIAARNTRFNQSITGIRPNNFTLQKPLPPRNQEFGGSTAGEGAAKKRNDGEGKRDPESDRTTDRGLFDSSGCPDFLITAYTAGFESTQKRPGDPGYRQTATGTEVKEGRTIAADWAVLPPGTIVKIEGLTGTYTVEDRSASKEQGGKVNGYHIDLFMEDLDQALEWGRKHRKIQIIEKERYK